MYDYWKNGKGGNYESLRVSPPKELQALQGKDADVDPVPELKEEEVKRKLRQLLLPDQLT